MSISRVTQTMLSRTVLHNLNVLAQRLAKSQEQLTSGYVVNRPSDDPVRAFQALNLQTELANHEQYAKNIDYARGWVDATDAALHRIQENLHRIRELLLQAANDTISHSDRQKIVMELEGLADDLKTQGNSKYQGEFIFAGTLTDAAPYTLGPSDAYAGNDTGVVREIAPGVRVAINQIGRVVLGDDTQGLLFHLRELITHLQSGTPADLDLVRNQDLRNLDADLEVLNQARTQVGTLQQRLELSDFRLMELKGSAEELLSKIREADVIEAYVKFTQQKATYEAALKTGASIMQPSLLDYIH